MAIEEKKYFPSQTEDEEIFLLIRRHWFDYMIFVFVAFLILILTIGIAWYLVVNQGNLSQVTAVFLIITDSVLILLLLAVELYGFVNHYLDVYIVTNQRLVEITQNGFFNRDISELQIRQVQDVSAHVDGIFRTLLHFGDVYIQTAGERENFTFSNIPHPYTVSKQIIDLHEMALESGEEDSDSEVKKYNEDELEKGLEIEEVEQAAKDLINDPSKTVRRVQGVYIPKKNTTAIESFSKTDDVQLHELEEGKEEKISDK
ncbi:hypothetical protein COT78_02230 [Candidatus Berkelbacteria bacterium CG10_big_fil_rev_8_21_14_0_10_43_13]|uniref:YdbS-like PH domain-containing protein n=1 Tax=Candidatus Berkelbacteria bacterium CG10_big_fil_rev_8_21_14_0_10_43_13 TaxID=1974514 RepID=A0A2H0W6P2_9BACT|nr:MAG: hypothetical protein COT78_02230 [Candidatus Berkelbacteria bacterium CG10_big_fil_rev_8_21_14_0_10_43_13]